MISQKLWDWLLYDMFKVSIFRGQMFRDESDINKISNTSINPIPSITQIKSTMLFESEQPTGWKQVITFTHGNQSYVMNKTLCAMLF